jgi:hypothetical protein
LSLTERAEVTEKDRQYPMSNGQWSLKGRIVWF